VISHQIWFWAKPSEREVPQAGVLGAADAVLAPGPAPVPQFQVRELAFPGAGGEGGEPVPVDVGEPQLRAGMGPFLADDDPHPGRPGRQVQHPGDVRDPGAVPDLPVSVVSRRPRIRRDPEDGGLHLPGDRHADRIVQPPRWGGQPVQEPVRPAAGVSADQDPAPQVTRQLGQRQPGRLDMVGRRVRPGAPTPQHEGQRLPAPASAVAGEGGHGLEAERLLPRGSGFLFLRVGDHDRGVQVDRDQPAARARRGVPGQRPSPLPGRRPGGPDRLQRPRQVPASWLTSRDTTGSDATGPSGDTVTWVVRALFFT
jgi:hypothetical protein